MTKKTIGVNPLTEYLSFAQAIGKQADSQQTNNTSKKKQRVTIHVPIDLIERVKNAVYWEPGLTVAGFAESALATAIEQLEKERGGPYQPRKQQLKGGRPLS